MERVVQRDFFISYNRADRAWAEWIGWQLEEAGYSTILQAWDFRPGQNFVLAMQEATTAARRTIAILSPEYVASRFTQPEWAAAFAQDPTGSLGTLVPVRVRAVELYGLLPQIVYIDLVGRDAAHASAELLRGIRRDRDKPTVAPPFPGEGHAGEPQPDARPFPRSPAPRPMASRVDKRELRRKLVAYFSIEELGLLCADVEQDLMEAGVDGVRVHLDMIGGEGLEGRAQALIAYLERRGYLDYLVNNARQARPGLL